MKDRKQIERFMTSHEDAVALHAIGAISNEELRAFDDGLLTPSGKLCKSPLSAANYETAEMLYEMGHYSDRQMRKAAQDCLVPEKSAAPVPRRPHLSRPVAIPA
jgi:DNA-binding transcriptional regulator YiaG